MHEHLVEILEDNDTLMSERLGILFLGMLDNLRGTLRIEANTDQIAQEILQFCTYQIYPLLSEQDADDPRVEPELPSRGPGLTIQTDFVVEGTNNRSEPVCYLLWEDKSNTAFDHQAPRVVDLGQNGFSFNMTRQSRFENEKAIVSKVRCTITTGYSYLHFTSSHITPWIIQPMHFIGPFYTEVTDTLYSSSAVYYARAKSDLWSPTPTFWISTIDHPLIGLIVYMLLTKGISQEEMVRALELQVPLNTSLVSKDFPSDPESPTAEEPDEPTDDIVHSVRIHFAIRLLF